MEQPDSPRQRLLLALSIVSGRRSTQTLTADEDLLLGFEGWGAKMYADGWVKQKCEALLADAILAGGYQ